MFDKNKFKSTLLLEGKTMKEVAKHLDITLSTLYRKINGESDFYRNEMNKLKEYLNLENPEDMFFG